MWLSVWDKTVSEFTVWNTPIKQGADEWNLFRWKNRKTFSYTWSEQSFTVPADWYYTLECWGAEWGMCNGDLNRRWWRWWYAKWKVYLTAWTVLKIYVWWQWKRWQNSAWRNGWWHWWHYSYRSINDSGWWGWATDIRIWWDTLYHRLIVAWGWGWGNAAWDEFSYGYGWWESGWPSRSWDYGWKQTVAWGNASFWQWASNNGSVWNNYWWAWGWGWWYGWWSATGTSDSWNNNYTAWGWSWFVWEGQDTVPSEYLVSEDYILDETENIAWNQLVPSKTWTWTTNWSEWDWFVVISFSYGSKSEKITQAGIYHNEELWLISMSADGENRITISDKNAGAWSDDIEDELSYGWYFQFGNIHWFWVLPEPVPPEPTPRREPWENTLLYMPLNWDVLDYSWNDNDGTITWTIEQRTIWIWDRKYAYFNNDSAIWLVSVPVWTWNVESHTFCCWAKVSPNWVCCPFFMGTDSNGQRYSLVLNYWTSSFQHIMDVYGSPDVPLSSSMWSKQYADQRVHIVYTYDKSTSTHTLYLNTVQSGSSNLRGLNIWSNNKYIWRSQSENWYWLSEIIFEQWIRTQQQIDDHFNLTKSAYWIN